ncbi:hypothetical protein M3Y96_00345500 [Aphelenchoides besseyi]|nr:hypothetical protein M3Y96_00345500 [Aphelenchoides besseyi]
MSTKPPKNTMSSSVQTRAAHKQAVQEKIQQLESLRDQEVEKNVVVADELYNCRRKTKKVVREVTAKDLQKVLTCPLEPLKLELEKPVDPALESENQREFEEKLNDFERHKQEQTEKLAQLWEKKENMIRLSNLIS